MSVQIDVRYEGDLFCTATHGPSGSTFLTEAPVDNGGKGTAFSPTDLVGTALGTCILTVMGIVAARAGIDMKGATARATKEMVTGAERRIGRLEVIVTMPAGKSYAEAERQRLEEAAHLCPVERSLHPETKVDLRIEW